MGVGGSTCSLHFVHHSSMAVPSFLFSQLDSTGNPHPNLPQLPRCSNIIVWGSGTWGRGEWGCSGRSTHEAVQSEKVDSTPQDCLHQGQQDDCHRWLCAERIRGPYPTSREVCCLPSTQVRVISRKLPCLVHPSVRYPLLTVQAGSDGVADGSLRITKKNFSSSS